MGEGVVVTHLEVVFENTVQDALCLKKTQKKQHSERWSSFNIEYKMEELTEQKNWEVEFTKYWNFK